MSIILDTRTQSTLKRFQYNVRQDPGGYDNILVYYQKFYQQTWKSEYSVHI